MPFFLYNYLKVNERSVSMKYVFLVSHGMFAPGLHDTLLMLAGSEHTDIISTSLKNGIGADEFAENVRECISGITEDDEIILFGDIVGGSPLTTTANVIAERGLMSKTIMVGGMNLPLTLSAVLMKDTMDTAEMIAGLIEESRDELKEFQITIDESESEI